MAVTDYLMANFKNVDVLPLVHPHAIQFEGVASFNTAAFDRINCVMFITTS